MNRAAPLAFSALLHLTGSADSSGDTRRNEKLAVARADSVRAAFRAAGVDGAKI
jgi:outer membrane protein OmpA-like peptidoglycan-associated protein